MTRSSAANAASGAEYEAERAARIAENNKRMKELGIHQTVADLTTTIKQTSTKSSSTQPRKRKQYFINMPVRRSGRIQGTDPENLDEDEMFRKIGIDRLDLIVPTRRRRINMDPSKLNSMRAKRITKVDGDESKETTAASVTVFDSGLGVRIQGGRVYDSKYGETCHWCRQKTLEEHVQCTNESCGGGNRLPVAFCRMCLRNRHGEDIAQAIASECWICPACRGNCGDGCVSCCNCGPCRKKAGLGPTHQLIKQARAAGIPNVHDFLVHKATGESAEAIAARKAAFPWGQWLSKPYSPPVEEEDEAEEHVAGGAKARDTTSEKQEHRRQSLSAEAVPTPSGGESLADAPSSGYNTALEDAETESEDEATRARMLNTLGARVMRAVITNGGKKETSRKERILKKMGLRTIRA